MAAEQRLVVATDAHGQVYSELEQAWPALWLRGKAIFTEIARLQPGNGAVLDYGVVRVRARAKLAARVSGLTTDPGAKIVVGVRYVADEHDSDRLFGPEVEVLPTRGVAAVMLDVEALRELYLVVKGPGLSKSLRAQTARAESGETVELAVDLGALCSFEGRLVGVPAGSASRCTVTSWSLANPGTSNEGANEELGPQSERQEFLLSEVGEDGRFSMHGIEQASLRLALTVGVEQVPLVRADARTEVPLACETREIELVPAEPLVAIGVFERDGRGPLPLQAFVSVGGRGIHTPNALTHGWWLVKLSALGGGATLAVQAAELGWARVKGAEARVDPDGALRLWTDEFARLEGAIVATFEVEPADGLKLECRQLAGEVRLSGLEPPAGVSTSLHGASAVEFRALLSGRHELVWRRGHAVRSALVLEHVEGSLTHVRLVPPTPREAEGQVRMTNVPSADAPALPPVVAVRLDVERSVVSDGGFRCVVLDPTPTSAIVELENDLELAAECSMGPSGSLEVVVDCSRLRTLGAVPLFGGRLCAESIPGASTLSNWHRPASFIQATAPGLLHLARSGPGSAVRIWEIGPKFKLLRGWCLPDEKREPDLDGRWVELAFATPRGPVRVVAVRPLDLTGAPIAEVESSSASRLWLPRSARTLLLRFFDGSTIELQVDSDALMVP